MYAIPVPGQLQYPGYTTDNTQHTLHTKYSVSATADREGGLYKVAFAVPIGMLLKF